MADGPDRAAHIAREVRKRFPGFLFMAEVYWDLEWTMQQQGFDYAYDKRLYDRLREGHARPVREHLFAGLDYQDKLQRVERELSQLRKQSYLSSQQSVFSSSMTSTRVYVIAVVK